MHVATKLMGEAYPASPLVPHDGMQFAEEGSCIRDSEQYVLRMINETL
jgi:hypothetical protein